VGKCTKNVLALEDKLFYKYNMPSCQGKPDHWEPVRCYYCLCASFTIADSESSSSSGEDEIYRKSKTHNKTEVTYHIVTMCMGWMIMKLVENKHFSEASFGGQ